MVFGKELGEFVSNAARGAGDESGFAIIHHVSREGRVAPDASSGDFRQTAALCAAGQAGRLPPRGPWLFYSFYLSRARAPAPYLLLFPIYKDR